MNMLDKYLEKKLAELRDMWKQQKIATDAFPNELNKDMLYMIECEGKEVRNLVNHFDTKQPRGVILYQFEQKIKHAHERAFNDIQKMAIQKVYAEAIDFVDMFVDL